MTRKIAATRRTTNKSQYRYVPPDFFNPQLATTAQLDAWQQRLAAHIAAHRGEAALVKLPVVDKPALRVLCVLPHCELTREQERRLLDHIADARHQAEEDGSAPARHLVVAEDSALTPLQERLRCHAREHCSDWLLVDFTSQAGMYEDGCEVELDTENGVEEWKRAPWAKLRERYDRVFVEESEAGQCLGLPGKANAGLLARLFSSVPQSRVRFVHTVGWPQTRFTTIEPTLTALLAEVGRVLSDRQRQLAMPWAAAPRVIAAANAADALIDEFAGTA